MALLIPSIVGGKAAAQAVRAAAPLAPTQPQGAVAPVQPQVAVAPAQPQEGLVIPGTVSQSAATARPPAGPVSGPQPAPEPEEERGFFGRVADVFTGRDRETRATRELPELGVGGLLSGESKLRIGVIAPLLLTTTDPSEIADILTSNFPNIGISQDEKGNLIAANNKTGARVVINKPGLSKIDIAQGLSIGAAFLPAGRAASIGTRGLAAGAGLLSRQTGRLVAQRGALGAAGAGVTEAGIQQAQALGGGRFDPSQVRQAAALGALGELPGPLISGFRQGRQVARIGAEGQSIADVAQNVAQARQASEATGIPLFQAQQTGIPAQLEKQAFLPSLPASTQRASREISRQNQAAGSAVDDLLNSIAPAEAVTIGPGRFRSAAQRAIEKKKVLRAEKSSPFYREAFKDKSGIDTKAIQDNIRETLQDFPSGGEVSKNLERVNAFIKGDGGELPTIRRLHNAKLEIDQMINKVGTESLGNTTKARLVDTKNQLLSLMDESSPSYASAREAFRNSTPEVLQLEDSIIGQVANLDDTQLKRISARIFDPAETNVEVVRNAKRVIDDVDPDAWNLLFRNEIERRLGSIKSNLSEGTLENVPGQLQRAIFGNAKNRQILKAGTDGEVSKNLNYLNEALSRASRGRGVGSQTATREEIKRELRGGILSTISNLFSPAKSTQDVLRSATFDNRAKALADVLFDPRWKPQMKKLRQLNPNSPAAARVLTQLLKDASEEEAE